MREKARKKKMGLCSVLLLAGVLGCSGCGDDVTATLTPVRLEDLVQVLPVEESTAADDAIEEDAAVAEEPTTENESTPEPSTEPTVSPEPEQVSITISAAGDVTLGNHHEQDYYFSFRQAYDQAEDAGYFLENVQEIFAADDCTLVNLEGALTTSEAMREGQVYYIKGDPEYAGILTAGSVEAVSLANNHRLDYGEQGSTDTVQALEQEGIVYAYDKNVGTYETKGIRIGFISVNEVGMGSGVEKLIQNGIAELQEQEADLIIVSCHWGTERENHPESYQQKLGRNCIDWGADLVLGHHPHVLQGIEEYQGKYIVYSLANFCFGANRNPADKDTLIFQQTFTFTDGVREEESTARVIPCFVSSVTNRNDFRPTPAEGEDSERILQRLREYSQGYGITIEEDGTITSLQE